MAAVGRWSSVKGENVSLDTSGFSGSLSSADYNVQLALETLDSGTGGGGSLDTTNFDGILSAADDTIQKAMDTIDDLSAVKLNLTVPGNLDAVTIGGGTPGSIVGTTIDATTDFTVGGTVISDASITDDGLLTVNCATGIDIQEGGTSLIFTDFGTVEMRAGDLYVGRADVQRGNINLMGQATGGDSGGQIIIHTAEDHDTTISTYLIFADQDDLKIGPSTDQDSLKYDGGANQWQFTGTNGVAIGGTVITDATITDDGNLTINPNTALLITGTGNVSIGVTDTTAANVWLFGDNNVTGGSQRFYTGANADATIDYFTIGASSDNLVIGPSTDLDALQFTGATNNWDLTRSARFVEAAITSTSNATAWDVNIAQTAVHTLTENTTIGAPSNLKAGSTYILRVVQAAGVYTLAFNAVFDWGTASAPTAPAADGDVIILSFYSDGTTIYGVEAVRVEA